MSLRYEDGFLMGHTAGNLWLLGLVKTYGFLPGIDHAHRLLGYTHRVIPVTETLHDIVVTKRDGTIVIGEGNIIADTDITHNIKSINLSPAVPASPEALSAIEKADILIVGPGTLYTSLIASLLPV